MFTLEIKFEVMYKNNKTKNKKGKGTVGMVSSMSGMERSSLFCKKSACLGSNWSGPGSHHMRTNFTLKIINISGLYFPFFGLFSG